MRRAVASLVAAGLAAACALLYAQSGGAPPPPADDEAPVIGTRLAALPDGPMKSVADAACLNCHSADMIRQQRLTEKQWGANVTKMIGWGAAVPEDQKDALVAYLVAHFGPDNDKFAPVVARPAP